MSVDLAVGEPGSRTVVQDYRCPDVYFTCGYGVAAASMEGGAWRMMSWEDRILIPLVFRPGAESPIDASSPYGYSGIYVSPDCTRAQVEEFWRLVIEFWREAGVVAVFLRFSPMELRSVEAVAGLPSIDLVRRGDTVLIPVGHGAGLLRAQLAGSCRRAIRKAEECGLVGGVRPVAGEDLAPGSPFRRLYESTMHRVSSDPKYIFEDDYYSKLLAGAGSALQIAEVRRPDGDVVASALLLTHADRVHYHLGGSAPEALAMRCNNLLIWSFIKWADESGKRLVHLGGGLSTGDSLFRFKKTFGGTLGQFWTASVVVCPDRYSELVERHAANLSVAVEDLEASNFFPAYRWPGPS